MLEPNQLLYNYQLSTINYQLSTINYPLSTTMTGIEPFLIPGAKILWELIKSLGGNSFQSITDILQAQKAIKKYFDKYKSRYGLLKLLAMPQSVDLESVYTPVRFLDRLTIGSFQSLQDLEEAYRESARRRFQREKSDNRDGIEVAKENQYLMVLGGPGAGKSTFLRRVGLEAFKGKDGKYQHDCLPVLLELKRFQSDENNKINLIKAITEEFHNFGFPLSEEFTIKALERGKLLVLLDGLDEVPKINLAKVIDGIESLVTRYENNRFIASCRIAAYRSLTQFRDIQLADFEDHQIQQFINNWFQSNLDKESDTAAKCWSTLNQEKNKSAKELAQTPLLLTFLCLVYGESLSFPPNRSRLYQKALDIFLKKWAAEKRVEYGEICSGLNVEVEKVLLSQIAYDSFATNQLFFRQDELGKQMKDFLQDTVDKPKYFDSKAVLEAIAIQQGILVERAEEFYSFSHLTLQEFLTAFFIKKEDKLEELVNQHLTDERWREVFLLVAGLKSRADELLELMEVGARKLIDTPKLKELLLWAEEATAGSEGDISPGGKRAIAITLAYAYADTLADTKAYTLGKACTLINALAYANTYSNLNALVEALFHANVFTITKAFIKDYTKDYTYALDQFIELAGDLEKFKIFSQVNFTNLIENLQALKAKIPEDSSTKKVDREFSFLIVDTWLEALDLNHEQVTLSEGELTALQKYFYVNKLIVDCKEAAVRVSRTTWSKIEQKMLIVDS